VVNDLVWSGARRQAELVRNREVRACELVELYLGRIAAANPALRAFRAVAADPAIEAANHVDAMLERGQDPGLLAGVCLGVKDDIDVSGDVTTHGTDAYERTPADKDAALVAALRNAGAILVGRTTMPELAMWPFTESPTWGQTTNPWRADRTAGGSSGGSAAAVASGLVSAATGSDGAGSIRIPAASCGLFGLKPQRGRVSLAPLHEHWYGLTSYGFLTRSVTDTALLLDVADASSVPRSSFVAATDRPPPRLRIAVSLRPQVDGPTVSTDVAHAVQGTAELLRQLGHSADEADPAYGDFLRSGWVERYFAGIAAEAKTLAYPERLEARAQAAIALGSALAGDPLDQARAAEVDYARQVNRIFDSYDVLLMPVVATAAPPADRWHGLDLRETLEEGSLWACFTAVWNVTGQPAASVPAGLTAEGDPLAVQLVTRPGDERLLISLASEIENAKPWADSLPPAAP
jgi:amidase